MTVGSNGSGNEPFAAILNRRISRRALVRAVTVGAPLIALGTSPLGSRLLGSAPFTNQAQAALSSVGIASIPNDLDDRINIAEGYAVDVLIRWGDPVTTDAPVFALELQTARGAGEQFGFNCDLNAFFPLYPGATDRGLLAVNHEYTTGGDMFPDYDPASPTEDQVLVQVANHGMSIIEVAQNRLGPWEYRRISSFNRRITGTTPMQLTGPAAGHELMQTSTDPTGRRVLGMFNNCAGGKTPWGTVLTCEENFHGYFGFSDEIEDELAKTRNARYGVSRADGRYKWERFIDRFDLRKEPNEVHRFGYVVEIDPFDPTSTPRKHTAMGRFKHEAANTALADDGRIVVYSGDDERFEYIYKFVTRERFDPYDRADESLAAGVGHPLRRQIRRLRFRRVDSARARGAAGRLDAGRNLDLHPSRRRRRGRHADGSPGGCRGQPREQARLCGADQQHTAQRGAGRRPQPAGTQHSRAHPRTDRERRRLRLDPLHLGHLHPLRRSRGR